MRYTIQHQGIPVATFEAERGAIGSVIVQILPGFESIRPAIAAWWALPATDIRVGAGDSPLRQTSHPRPIFDLVDELGRHVPTCEIELRVSGPTTALALITVDESAAGVGSVVPLPPRGDTARRRSDER